MWHSKKDKIYYVVTDFTIVKIDQIKIEKLEGE